MMKKLLLAVFSALILSMGSITLSAQSIVSDLTSASAVALRDPARQASTEIDAVIYNPAGTALMDDGLHISISGIANFNTSDSKYDSKTFKIKNNYVVPSAQVVYKKDKWAFSGSFASEGGYASRKYDNGSPYAAYLINAVANAFGVSNIDQALPDYLLLLNALKYYCAAQGIEPPINLDFNDKLHLDNSQYNSHLYNWAIRLGASYRITDNFSAYTGVKISNVSWSNNMNTTLYVQNPETNTNVPYDKLIQEAKVAVSKLDDEKIKELYTSIFDLMSELPKGFDDILAKSYSGWSITPVIGLDYKTSNLNFGARFDFGSSIYAGDGKYFSLPAILSMGSRWQASNKFAFALGSSLYFKTSATPLMELDNKLRADVSLSATFNLSKKIILSAGYLMGFKIVNNDDILALEVKTHPSISYNFPWFSTFPLGCGINVTDALQLNLGASISGRVKGTYNYYDLSNNKQETIIDNIKPTVKVGLGMNYRF